MKEYDVFVPLNYNDGSPVEDDVIQHIGERLLERFGGLTLFPQPNKGFWKMGDVTFQVQIVIFRVVTAKVAAARKFLKQLKKELKVSLDQEEILIIERDVRTL